MPRITHIHFILTLVCLALIGVAGRFAYPYVSMMQALPDRLAGLEEKIDTIDRKINLVDSSAKNAASLQKDVAEKQLLELAKRVEREEKAPKVVTVSSPLGASREEQITQAVSRATSAVASVVISKDVPQLEVVCQNPFGNDPFFKDADICFRTFRQKGVQKTKVGAGTGFLISKNGYIVTNRHVVEDVQAEYTVLLSDGAQKAASVVYRDALYDIALIKIEGSNFTKVDLGNSDAVKLGQTVIAIGNALGEYNNSVSVGIISGLNRVVQASTGSGKTEELKGVFQTDAAINPGNSGGPLLALDGKVVGMNVATVIGSSNISFSIPVNKVRDIVRNVVPGI